ncbi:MAG: DNA polymerase III subunit delta [Spirochaetota bacterium]
MEKDKYKGTITPAILFNELGEGIVHPVYLFLGEERGGKELFIENLRAKLSGDSAGGSSVDITIYHGDEALPERILEDLKTYPIFSSRKIIIVHDFDRMVGNSLLIEYLRTPGGISVLILLSDKRSVSKQVMELVQQQGRVCIFWPMFLPQGERWVADKMRRLGIKADRNTIRYIVEISGTDTENLHNQILNIKDYLGDESELTYEKAQSIVAATGTHTVFDLAQSLFQKPAKEMISLFREIVNNGESLTRILFFCSRELIKIFTVCTLKYEGYGFQEIVRRLGLKKMESERIYKILGMIDLKSFPLLFSAVTKLEYILKSTPDELGQVEFERFLVEMGSTGGEKNARCGKHR